MWEKIVGGSSAELFDFIAISKSMDMLTRMYLYLREIKRFEPERPIAPLHFLDLALYGRDMDSQRWNIKMLSKFILALEGWTSQKLNDGKLSDAIMVCNENSLAFREFVNLRYGPQCRVTGSEALTVIGASLLMPKEESTALIKNLTKAAAEWPVVDSPGILYIGSAHEDRELYGLVEELGGNIISEDHDWGDRNFDKLTSTKLPPRDAVLDRYMYRPPCCERGTIKDRVTLLKQLVEKTGAEGVLFYTHFNDEAFLWDYPKQKHMLDEIGIPSHLITKQQIPIKDKDNVAAGLSDFIGSI